MKALLVNCYSMNVGYSIYVFHVLMANNATIGDSWICRTGKWRSRTRANVYTAYDEKL